MYIGDRSREEKEALLVLPSVPLVLDSKTVSTFTGKSTQVSAVLLKHWNTNCMRWTAAVKVVSWCSLSLRVRFFPRDRLVNIFIFPSPKCCHSSSLCRFQVSSMMADGEMLISNILAPPNDSEFKFFLITHSLNPKFSTEHKNNSSLLLPLDWQLMLRWSHTHTHLPPTPPTARTHTLCITVKPAANRPHGLLHASVYSFSF